MTLGENIVRLRTKENLSQSDLADMLDVSRQSVSKWETDASIPELDKLLKLSELFGVTLDELVNGEETSKIEVVPVSEHEKRRTITGTVLLCTGVVIMILCLLLAGDLLAGLLLGYHLSFVALFVLWLRNMLDYAVDGQYIYVLTYTYVLRLVFLGLLFL